ncbi:MAG TPA: methyltransferase domain-containing protein [Candidatus Dormibacteraeota bacterium]|jgi:ubiquinone/menaquinone biosynthesis C-methylase UbiE
MAGASETDAARDSKFGHQQQVDAHFDAKSRYWKDLYEEDTLFGVIHQQRKQLALQWLDECRLPKGSRVLDVGCGAGVLAVELARRGHVVDGIDASHAMIEQASQVLGDAGVAHNVHVQVGDAHDLPFATASYDFVVSLGVLPYVHTPTRALSEMARVVKPDGYVLLSSDNAFRLNHLLDPRYNPVFLPLRQAVKHVLMRMGYRPRGVPSRRLSFRHLRRLMSQAGLSVVNYQTLGFGPFSLLGRRLLPDRVGLKLHRSLQKAADRGAPILRSTGTQQLVLARRLQETRNQAR